MAGSPLSYSIVRYQHCAPGSFHILSVIFCRPESFLSGGSNIDIFVRSPKCDGPEIPFHLLDKQFRRIGGLDQIVERQSV